MYADSPAEAPSNIAQRNNEAYNNNEDPLLIIEQRLARGDITIEEYEILRHALER